MTAGAPTIVRYPVDLVRVALGLAVFGLGFLVAQQGRLPRFEENLFRLVNDLPGVVYPLVWLVMQLGNVLAVPAVAVAAALTRRYRMARDLAVSGLLAYLAADVVKGVVGRERPAGFPVDAALRDGTVSGIGFVSGHAAVAAALATAAVPYLSRRGRRLAWASAWSVALARVYVGAHLPLDVVGGVAVGWAIGSLVHWVFGIPRWRPVPRKVAALLHRYGLPVRDLAPAPVVARSSHPFVARDERDRRLYVKALDPDRFERDWIYRLYRLVAVRDIKDADAVAPLGRQAEHEAVAAMTARERGVRVPPVVLARGSDKGAVVVQEFVDGRVLDALPVDELTADLLCRVWAQVALLRRARVAHHDLVVTSVLVDDGGRVWVVDFGNAVTGADDDALAGDVAELMASLAVRVRPRLVVDTAVDTVGAAAVATALPRLVPLALSAATRAEVREGTGRLAELRYEVRRRLDLPDPARPEFPPPGAAARLAVAAGSAAVLLGLLVLGDVADVVAPVAEGGWRWLGGAVALAVLARAASAAAALMTVDRRLAVGRTYGAGMVAEASTLLHGRSGWRRSAARFLERAGVLPTAAQTAVDRFVAGAVAAASIVAIGTFVLAVVEGRLTGWRAPEALLPALLLGLGSWGLVLTGQGLARRRVPARDRNRGARPRPRALWAGAAPGRWAAQLSWSVLGVALEAATLAAALHGVGGQVAVLATATVYGALHLLWWAVPVTGAPGAADVALLLGLSALGAPLASAAVGVVVFRLLAFWLPAAAGTLLTARFERRFGP